MEITESLRELFLCCVCQRTNERKQHLPSFGLGFERRSSYDNALHVKVAHLERNALKYRDVSTKAITRHRENDVS